MKLISIASKWPLFLIPLFTAAACGGASAPKGGDANGIAVVTSDYKSTVVSLVNPATGALAQDDCLDSGSVTPVLSMALSGDVVLASSPQPGGQLVLIDRTNSALAWVVPKSCTVSRQLAVGTGFYSNPHDVVGLAADKAYVTRFETNPTPSGNAGANDQGNDVLIINPAAGTITGRIDLAPYATSVAGATIQARPDRALLANGKVYVTLGDISKDFKTLGAGRVVVIDPSQDKVTGTIDLPDYRSCSGLDYLDSVQTLLVGCSGDFNQPLATQTAQSAIVVVDVSGSAPHVKKAIGGAVVGARPLAAFSFAGDNLLVAATFGDGSGTPPDALWAIALDAGSATKIADADGSFVFGGLVWSAAQHQLLVSDASMTKPTVRVFDVSQPGAVRALAGFEANPKAGLPPRQIGWY